MKIGIDIGGVVIGGGDSAQDTSFFSDNYLRTPEIPGAITALERLQQAHEITFISKAYPRTAQKTIEWLAQAGLSHIPLVFCRERWQKAPIARLLELDLFIDDRQDICESMHDYRISYIRFVSWDLTSQMIPN